MFNLERFRASVFAAYVAQDWDAVANALLLIQTATGREVLQGEPTPDDVRVWADRLVAELATEAAVVSITGDLHPRLQCNNPRCAEHGHAVRLRAARARIARGAVFLQDPVAGEH